MFELSHGLKSHSHLIPHILCINILFPLMWTERTLLLLVCRFPSSFYEQHNIAALSYIVCHQQHHRNIPQYTWFVYYNRADNKCMKKRTWCCLFWQESVNYSLSNIKQCMVVIYGRVVMHLLHGPQRTGIKIVIFNIIVANTTVYHYSNKMPGLGGSVRVRKHQTIITSKSDLWIK